MSTSTASAENMVGVELKLPQNSDAKLYKKIFSLFQKLNIDTVFLKLYPENFKTFNAFIEPDQKKWNLIYGHTPLLNNIILKDLHKTKQIFQPQLFCRKNYFKQHKSWGYPIFYFTDDESEIYHYSDDISEIKQNFDYPEDIVAIILLRKESGAFISKNIIHMLERTHGNIDVKVKKGFEYKLVIIRKLYLYYENGLNYKLNIHDEYLLKKQSELAAFHIGANHFKGAYLNADDFFSYDGFITSGPEITRNYRRISESQFKQDMALFWNKFGNNSEIQNINYTRMINTYIDGILLPKLYYIHQTPLLRADILNPFFINNLSVLKTIYKIKDEHFIFHKKYFIKALINIKRVSNYKAAHNDFNFTIIFDDLINISHSFFEKKISIDALLAAGVNKILFQYNAEDDADSFILGNIFQKDENIKLYNGWLKYINRLAYYLSKGKPASRILVLYPSLDNDRSDFEKTISILERSCFDYDIMDFSTFIQDEKVIIDLKKLFFNDRSYHTLIISHIHKIPLKALRKIKSFITSGGISIGLGYLPLEIESQEDQGKLKELLKQIWLEESKLTSTNFKKHSSGGIGYFQRDNFRLLPLLSENQDISGNYPLFTNHPNIKITVRDCDDHYLGFITNTAKEPQENIIISSKTSGSVFRVSPQDDLLYALGMTDTTEDRTIINLSLEQNESILLKLEKIKTDLPENAKPCPESNSEFLEISDNGWIIQIGDKQEVVSLGDRSSINPYEWQPLIYQKTIELDNEQLFASKIYIQFTELRDWCTLWVNDQKISAKLYPPWEFEISNFLKIGKNLIRIEIGHTISNYLAMRYGDEKSAIPVAAYGLFGPVKLKFDFLHMQD